MSASRQGAGEGRHDGARLPVGRRQAEQRDVDDVLRVRRVDRGAQVERQSAVGLRAPALVAVRAGAGVDERAAVLGRSRRPGSPGCPPTTRRARISAAAARAASAACIRSGAGSPITSAAYVAIARTSSSGSRPRFPVTSAIGPRETPWSACQPCAQVECKALDGPGHRRRRVGVDRIGGPALRLAARPLGARDLGAEHVARRVAGAAMARAPPRGRRRGSRSRPCPGPARRRPRRGRAASSRRAPCGCCRGTADRSRAPCWRPAAGSSGRRRAPGCPRRSPG